MSNYPSFNDREFDLLKKICSSTASLADGSGIPLTIAEGDARYLKQASNLSDLTNTATARTNLGTAFNQVIAENANFNISASQNGAVFNVTTGASNVTATLPAGASGLFFILRKADSGAGIVLNSGTTTGLSVQGHSLMIYWDPNTAAWLSRSWFGSESATGAITISAGGVNQNVTVLPKGTAVLAIPFAGGITATGNEGIQLSSNNIPVIAFDSYNANFFGSTYLRLRRAQGTFSAPTAVLLGDKLGEINFDGFDGGAFSAQMAQISFSANENWSNTAHGTNGAVVVTVTGTTTTRAATKWNNTAIIDIGGLTGWNYNNQGANGVLFRVSAATINNNTASGTIAVHAVNSILASTITATSATTYTDSFGWLFGAGPAASTNVTQTRSHSVGINDGTSAASSITGALVIATTFGTAATSVGIGGGNINAGGTLTIGGTASIVGVATSGSSTATPAGGSAAARIAIGSAGVSFYIGTGNPTVSAAKGSIYSRTDATTTTTRLWVNTDGATTWTNLTTAA